ncbi:hypothetical protein Taro_018176 [Colocasia esculenta]|uniref:Retrotransposon gag domain-containing protein n=1 Tax=Colocasia esculenta TaxID=4460 RepID=A0A843UQ27_COLES|nr:hypothetical protein [Colocasia esculenta]
MCVTCSVQSSGRWEGDAQNAQGFCSARGRSCGDFCWVLVFSACPRCRESGRSKGNAGRSLHSAFFVKVVDAYRGYLSSWVPQCVVSLARLRPVRGRQTRVKHVTGLTGLDEAFRHNWYQSKVVVMVDRRDWGGGGDDPEESTQRMIERIWESLIDIRMRMDQQASVPPVIGEAVPVAPVPPPPGVEVPFEAPVPPLPPVIAAEEPVVQVERFLRLQPPTYSGEPNPDIAEHWIHEIERVFMTMRCPAADRVVLATFQLRGFAQEWWRLKMQTTFAGRIEAGKKGAVQDLAARWDFGSGISDAVHGTEQRSEQRTLGRRRSGLSRPDRDATMGRVLNRYKFLNNPSQAERLRFLLGQGEELWRFLLGFGIFGVSSLQGVREKQGKRREIAA